MRCYGPASDVGVASKGHYVSVSQWQVYRATMEEIRAGDGVLDVQGNHRDVKKDQGSGRNRARTRWLCIREKEPWEICEGLKGFEDD